MKCSHCGAPAEANDLFCVECGQPLSAAAPRAALPARSTRRWLLPLALLAVVLVVIGLAAVLFLDLVAPPPALSSLLSRPGDAQPSKSTRQPFIVVAQSGAIAADVAAVDLAGSLLAKLGSSEIVADQVALQITEPGHSFWPRWPAPPGISPAAYAWPSSSAALVMLPGDNGWDLLRYDAARAEIAALAQGVRSPSVVGYDNQDHFLASFGREASLSLVAANQQADQGVILVQDRAGSLTYALSPDGEHAAYVTDDLYAAQVNGERVNRQPGTYQSPVFSPDGQHLFYSNGRQLIRAGADGRRAQVIAQIGSNSHLRPLSAGASYLAVERNLNGESTVVVMTYDGKIVSQFGHQVVVDAPLFLQDGRGLLVTERNDAGRRLVLSDVKGKKTRTLVDAFSNVFVQPLRDDRHLAIVTVDDRGFNLALDDLRAETTQEVEQGLDQLWPLASNADYFVYAAQDQGRWSLRALRLDAGAIQGLDEGASQGYPSAFFLPDGKRLLYESRGQFAASGANLADGTPVWRYDIEGGIYRVALDDPQPELVYANAFLLAASLAR